MIFNLSGAKGQSPSDIVVIGDIDTDTSGMTIAYQASNLAFDGTSGINTGIQLFSSENIDRDFKLVIRDLYGDKGNAAVSAAITLLADKVETVSPYPGFAIRLNEPGINMGRISLMNAMLYDTFILQRVNGEFKAGVSLTLSNAFTGTTSQQNYPSPAIGQGGILSIGNMDIQTVHTVPLILGGSIDANGNLYRFCKGSMGSVVLAFGS